MRHEEKIRELPGLRYETCRYCGLRWNVAKGQTIARDGYICPRCRDKLRRGRMKAV